MPKFEITINYHKAFEKVKTIKAKSYEEAQEKAYAIVSNLEEQEGVHAAELEEIIEVEE